MYALKKKKIMLQTIAKVVAVSKARFNIEGIMVASPTLVNHNYDFT